MVCCLPWEGVSPDMSLEGVEMRQLPDWKWQVLMQILDTGFSDP